MILQATEAAPPIADPSALWRWGTYLGVFAAIGAVTLAILVHRRPALADRPDAAAALLSRAAARVGLGGALLLLLATLGRLHQQIRSFLEPGEPMTVAAARLIVVDTGWGRGWLAQLAGALALLAIFALGLGRPGRRALAALAVLATVFVAPLTGHATESPLGVTGGVLAQGAHLLTGGMWLGTLLAILVAGFGATRALDADARGTAIAELIHAFSPLALIGAGGAVAIGIGMAWLALPSLESLWTSVYGQALLVKTALLGAVAAVGAWNWRRVKPRLGTAEASGALRRSATFELLLGAVLLAVTAVLVALPLPAAS